MFVQLQKMKYAIQSVRNKAAGVRDRINVCRVGISNMTISAYRTVVTCLGKSNVFERAVEALELVFDRCRV